MKVVIDMSLEQFNRHVREHANTHAYIQPGEGVGFLNFEECEWRHDPECKDEHKSGHVCLNRTHNRQPRSFKVLQVLPSDV